MYIDIVEEKRSKGEQDRIQRTYGCKDGVSKGLKMVGHEMFSYILSHFGLLACNSNSISLGGAKGFQFV